MRNNRDSESWEDLDRPSLFKHLFIFAILTGIAVGVVWFLNRDGDVKIILEKLGTRMLMPVGLIWYTLMFVTYFSLVNRATALAFFSLVALLLVSLCGNEFIANRMVGTLEADFIDDRPLEGEPFDTLIVLGGGTKYPANGTEQLGASGDRIALAAQMYHAGKAKRLVCTGSGIESLTSDEAPDTSSVARVLLNRLGVPDEAIQTISGRNTREEMQALREFLGASESQTADSATQADAKERVGMITSAWHLPRAIRLAEKENLEVEPVAADFQSGEPYFSSLSVVPSSGSLNVSTMVAKEYLARFVGQ